jgi:hypothetical protein
MDFFEQRQLGAGAGPLAAGEDAHPRRPADQLAPRPVRRAAALTCAPCSEQRACAQMRPGQASSELPGWPRAIYRDLPGFAGHAVQGAAFPFAQFPADGADQLVAGPGGELTDIPSGGENHTVRRHRASRNRLHVPPVEPNPVIGRVMVGDCRQRRGMHWIQPRERTWMMTSRVVSTGEKALWDPDIDPRERQTSSA